MKKITSVAFLSICCLITANAANKIAIGTDIDAKEQIAESKKLAKTFSVKNNTTDSSSKDLHLSYYFDEAGREIPFRVCLPADWDGKTNIPMVMFLHGAGNTESSYLDQDNKLMVRLANEHNVILVSPLGAGGAYGNNLRLPGGFGKNTENSASLSKEIPAQRIKDQKISEKDVINVIEIVLDRYPIDRNRMFLTGHSMGSGGTWYIGGKYSTYWKALAPMSGPFVTEKDYPWDSLKDTPIFITEGTSGCPSLESSRMLKEFLEKRNYDVSYMEFNANHPGMVPLALPHVFDFFDKFIK